MYISLFNNSHRKYIVTPTMKYQICQIEGERNIQAKLIKIQSLNNDILISSKGKKFKHKSNMRKTKKKSIPNLW